MIHMTLSSHSRMDAICLISICMLAILATAGCERSNTTTQAGIEARQTNDTTVVVSQPAKAATETLLLLDDAEESASARGPAADNSRCFVCHINYEAEKLAASHARQSVGCANCHGPSDAHIADESWGSGGNGTAPDIMYPRDKINPGCMTCHPRDKLSAPQHELAFAKSDPKVCTDCHGDHRLSLRRCKWR
jgi:hypothetical protein